MMVDAVGLDIEISPFNSYCAGWAGSRSFLPMGVVREERGASWARAPRGISERLWLYVDSFD